MAAAATATSDMVCEDWPECNSDEYETAAPTATGFGRECASLTVCQTPEQWESKAPTKTTDRECENGRNLVVINYGYGKANWYAGYSGPKPGHCQSGCNGDSDCQSGHDCWKTSDRIHSACDHRGPGQADWPNTYFVPGCLGKTNGFTGTVPGTSTQKRDLGFCVKINHPDNFIRTECRSCWTNGHFDPGAHCYVYSVRAAQSGLETADTKYAYNWAP